MIYGDADRDGDVDGADFAAFDACRSGPGVALSAGCAGYDRDGDADVDLDEFGAFQRCYSGQNVAAQAACGA